jgi:4-hydroxybenzoate polyprenyltransferase
VIEDHCGMAERVAAAAYGLVRGCHPEAVVAVTAAAALLAVATGRGAAGVVAVAAAVLAGQLSIGWSNDWLDAGRDRRAGRADKPAARGAVGARTLRAAALIAAVAAVPLSLLSGPVAGVTHLVAVGAGWSYNRPLKATVLSVLPYLVGFGLLPAFVVLGLPGTPPPPWWLVTAGALLGAGAHFANTVPDLAADAATGVRGLPHRLGPAGSRIAGGVLLAAASVVLVLAPPGPPSWYGLLTLAVVAVAVPAGTAFSLRPGSRGAFRVVLVVGVADVVLLLLAGAGPR